MRYDTIAPTATSVGVLGGHLPTNQNPITLDFNFSEAVTRFSAGGVTVVSGGGAVTGVASASGESDRFHAYLAAPLNSTGGTIRVQLAAQAVLDLAGNKNGVGSVISVPYDYSKPTLTMNLSTTGLAAGAETIAKTPGVPVVVEIHSDEELAADLAASGVLGQRALMATAASPLRTVTSKRKFTVGLLPGDPSPGQGQGEAAAIVAAGAVSDLAVGAGFSCVALRPFTRAFKSRLHSSVFYSSLAPPQSMKKRRNRNSCNTLYKYSFKAFIEGG